MLIGGSKRIDYTELRARVEAKTPIQLAGRGEIVEDVLVGGPGGGMDTRLSFTVQELEKMLDMAKSTPMRSVVIHNVGLRFRKIRESGHTYKHVNIVAGHMEPMRVPLG